MTGPTIRRFECIMQSSRARPSIMTAGILVRVCCFFLSLTMCCDAQMSASYQAGLQLLAARWPALQNSTVTPSPWTNFSNACSFTYISCATPSATHFSSLSMTAAWGAENTSFVLPSLAANFINPWQHSINTLAVSVSSQTSLFISTMSQLMVRFSTMSAMGDVSGLTDLQQIYLEHLRYLTTAPTFGNSTHISQFQVLNCSSLTTFQGTWPSSSVLYDLIIEGTTVTSLPSLATTVNLDKFSLQNSPTTILSPLPSSLRILELENLPHLQNLPNLTAFSALQVLSIYGCYSLPPNTVPQVVSSILNSVTIRDLQLTAVPSWICSITLPNAIVDLSNNSIATLPECLGSLPLYSLYLNLPGPQIPWIPLGIFNRALPFGIDRLPIPHLEPDRPNYSLEST